MNQPTQPIDLSWLQQQGVREVECLVPDINGVPRGKGMPAATFMAKARQVGIPHSPQFFLGSILRIWIPVKAILGSSVYGTANFYILT